MKGGANNAVVGTMPTVGVGLESLNPKPRVSTSTLLLESCPPMAMAPVSEAEVEKKTF